MLERGWLWRVRPAARETTRALPDAVGAEVTALLTEMALAAAVEMAP